MGRKQRERQGRKRAAEQLAASAVPPAPPQLPVPRALLWLAAAFLLPNLGALVCSFVFDDRVVIVENESLHVHSLRQFGQLWTTGYWPDPRGQELYRPISKTLWAVLWAVGGGRPWVYHAVGLALGLAVVLLLYRFLLELETPPRTAFITAMLFALFPIHTEATTSVVGSAETLAAAFALAALILYWRGRVFPALALFALAVFSKESAAAFAALPLVLHKRRLSGDGISNDEPRKPAADSAGRTRAIYTGVGAAIIIGAALFAHQALSRSSRIPAIDNSASLVGAGPRILTALWVQCMYVFKTLAPITLSADYSYKQIPLVMNLDDWRAWAGLALAGGAAILAIQSQQFRAPVLAYAALFSATANVLFPIGTIMGERLAYAPSLGLALLFAILLARSRHWKTLLIAVALLYGVRTAVRNLDWRNPERFYTRLVETSPNSAKAQYSIGALRASLGDDVSAITAYDRAIAIFPAYAEAFRNRGNALARLGKNAEAMASYRECLRFDPTDYAAISNLMELQAGRSVYPPRKPL
jgi:tetratricopeptide (TPR) repeat protein